MQPLDPILNARSWQKRVLNWYAHSGRHDLPWQHPKTAYRVWISEVMLQQTQVKTVVPYFKRFMQRFPSLKALATASCDEVLALWTGLGYYSRARNLHRSAQHLINQHHGRFPKTIEQLTALPGIGRSTAGAILALAFNQSTPILDGNVKRVLVRTHGIKGWPEKSQINKALWLLSKHYTPATECAPYTQAMMDLGATLCTRTHPQCQQCPLRAHCIAYKTQQVTTLPTPKPRTHKPERACHFLLLEDSKQRLLLQQRPPSGIWGGLWSLPECELDQDINTWCQQQWGVQIKVIEHWPALRHTFSHFHLTLHPLRASLQSTESLMDSANLCWYDVHSKPPGGFAAPIKQLMLRYQRRTE